MGKCRKVTATIDSTAGVAAWFPGLGFGSDGTIKDALAKVGAGRLHGGVADTIVFGVGFGSGRKRDASAAGSEWELRGVGHVVWGVGLYDGTLVAEGACKSLRALCPRGFETACSNSANARRYFRWQRGARRIDTVTAKIAPHTSAAIQASIAGVAADVAQAETASGWG